MFRSVFIPSVLCASMALTSSLAVAQQRGPATAQRAAAGTGDEVMIRSYDVSDLIRTNMNYPAEGVSNMVLPVFSRSGQSQQAAIAPATKSPIDMESLVSLLLGTTNPESWQENGGNVGSVRPLGTILVVKQTRAAHDQISQMLGDLRQIVGPMQTMTVHATWVSAAPGSITRATTEATDEWMSKQKVFCESQISCFSGQTVHMVADSARSYVSDLQPVVASSAVGFDPVVSVLSTGATMQITPQVVPGSTDAIIDVQSVVSQPAGPMESSTVVALAGEVAKVQTNGTIDRASSISQKFHTTARVPLKKRTIVGGMTIDPAKPEGQGNQLYLVIEVSTGK